MRYQYFSDIENKMRNSFILAGTTFSVVIDPQASALGWMKEHLDSLDSGHAVMLVLSHEHDSHFNGLAEMLEMLRDYSIELTIYSPAQIVDPSLVAACKNVTEIEPDNPMIIEINDGAEVLQIEFKRAFGHCARLITVQVTTQEKNTLFLSDNLCTNFPPPITDGGSVEEMIRFYEDLVEKITGDVNLTLLPGHGVVKGQKHIVDLLDYYKALPQMQWDEVPPGIKDENFYQIGKIFHELNLQKAAVK